MRRATQRKRQPSVAAEMSTDDSRSRTRKRIVRDPEGHVWAVREFVHTDDGHENRSLIFDDGDAVRRIRNFPATWHLLPEDELALLSRHR